MICDLLQSSAGRYKNKATDLAARTTSSLSITPAMPAAKTNDADNYGYALQGAT